MTWARQEQKVQVIAISGITGGGAIVPERMQGTRRGPEPSENAGLPSFLLITDISDAPPTFTLASNNDIVTPEQ